MTYLQENWEDLANAIIISAVEDYQSAYKRLLRNPESEFRKKEVEKLEEFCELSGQNKTAVVERAVEKYIEENLEMIKEVAKRL